MALFVAESDLNRNCSCAEILCVFRWSWSCLYITFSSTFEKEHKKDNEGLTTSYFKQSGKVPEDIDLLHIWAKGEVIKGELIFNNLVDIPSYPKEFWGLRDFILFFISLVDTDLKLIFGNGFLND
jgi:hypothetical protein